MKKIFIAFIYFIIILFSYSCEKKGDDTPKTYEVKFKVNYQDEHATSHDRKFYIYRSDGSLVDSISNYASSTLLAEGEYQVIVVENGGSHFSKMQNLETACLKQAGDGNEDYFWGTQTINVPSETNVYVTNIQRTCGGFSVIQDPKKLLYPSIIEYITIELNRSDGSAIQLKDGLINSQPNTILSNNIYLSSQEPPSPTNNLLMLFPTTEESNIFLTLTFYDLQHNELAKWSFDEPIPIKRGYITSGTFDFNGPTGQPFQIIAEQRPIRYEDINIEFSDCVPIPNPNLLKILKKSYPDAFDENDQLNKNAECIKNSTTLYIGGEADIQDLTIIGEIFPHVKELRITDCKITSLDLSKFIHLNSFICGETTITSIDFKECKSLTSLTCFDNPNLQSINLNECSELNDMYLSDNKQLSSIHLLNNKKLKNIRINGLSMPELNLSNLELLEVLVCEKSSLKQLTLNGCTSLRILSCPDNLLTTLELEICKQLTSVCCSNNQLTTLDFSKNTLLTHIDARQNKLRTINIEDCTKLLQLICCNNQLTEIDINHCSLLESLTVFDNRLSTLNLNVCPNIQWINCSDNLLHSITFADITYKYLDALVTNGTKQTFTDIKNLTSEQMPRITHIDIPYSARNGNFIKKIYKTTTTISYFSCENENGEKLIYTGGD